MYGRPLCIVLLLGAASCAAPRPHISRPPPFSGMAADLTYLASELLEGREVGSAGGDSAAIFLADRYMQLGVKGAFAGDCAQVGPCGNTYFQAFRAEGMRAENVAVLVEGTDSTLRTRYVIVGAHYDHLGRSTRGALDAERGAALRVGADDNASGTAALLELGRRFVARPAPVSVVLVHFDAEELGLLGSREFVDNSPIPLEAVALMLNLDMIGRLRGASLVAEATAGTEPLRDLLANAASARGLLLEFSGIPEGKSDHLSFARRGVPSVAFFTGFHSDYHRATDTAEKIDLIGLARIVDVTEEVIRRVGVDR